MPAPAEPKASIETPDVRWVDVIRFIRQLSHDLRNQLNVVELQIAYVSELEHDPQIKTEITRLRETTLAISTALQKLTNSLGEVQLQTMPYQASEFVEDLKNKVESQFSKESGAIEWKTNLGEEMLKIDPHQLQHALLEIFANAFQHERQEGPIIVTAEGKDRRFTLTLREPKKNFSLSTARWAREPLRQSSRGHYGLGLQHARAILETHRGSLEARHEGSSLITTITLPLLEGEI